MRELMWKMIVKKELIQTIQEMERMRKININ